MRRLFEGGVYSRKYGNPAAEKEKRKRNHYLVEESISNAQKDWSEKGRLIEEQTLEGEGREAPLSFLPLVPREAECGKIMKSLIVGLQWIILED